MKWINAASEKEMLTVHCFARFELGAHDPGKIASNVSPLRNVASAEAQADHQRVEDLSSVLADEVSVERQRIRKAPSRYRGHHEVVREI